MKNLYLMTEQQIEALALERTTLVGDALKLDGTYLRALVVGAQSKLGPKRGKRPATDAQLTALEGIAAPFYAAVLRGVTTPDIAIDGEMEHAEIVLRNRERNRRAVFARTAKSTLVTWVGAGGDLRALDAETVTKAELRAQVTAASEGEAVTPESRIQKAQATILAAVAREGPEQARRYLSEVITALQLALGELPNGHHESTVIRTRAGLPSFREPARLLNRGAQT